MAGGLPNTGVPFTLNIKCIVFSMIIIALYLYKPPDIKNKFVLYSVLFGLFVISYVSMAWYDYYFECSSVPLRKGYASLQQYIKPPAHEPEKQIMHVETPHEHHKRMVLIYLSHIIFIVPFLLYIVYYEDNVNPVTYPLLGALAAFTLMYHSYSIISHQKHYI